MIPVAGFILNRQKEYETKITLDFCLILKSEKQFDPDFFVSIVWFWQQLTSN